MHPDTLFLHAGPGLNAHVERKVLRDIFPNIHFWDQPRIQSKDNAFGILVDAACAEACKLASQNGKRVHLLAHSFGGHLASALLDRIPDIIGDCRLTAALHDIPSGYLNLLRYMKDHAETNRSLRQEIAELPGMDGAVLGEADRIWEYYRLITRDPDFVRHYWPDNVKYRRYLELSRYGAPWDADTFQNVLNDFMASHNGYIQPVIRKSIWIELGTRDPLIQIDLETHLWKTRFPNARFFVKHGCGHFIHLEPYL